MTVVDVKAVAKPTDVVFVEVDDSSKQGAKRLVSAAVERYVSIDVQVNNAGITHAADFLDLA